jgi:hypothetical protein
MLEIDVDEDSTKSISSTVLAKQLDSFDRVLVMGDDQYGKTSLLLHLYQQYHSVGLVPLLLDAHSLGGLSDEQLARAIGKQVLFQYGDDASTKYSQTDIKKRIALVDNIDKAGNRSDVLARMVTYLSLHFGHVIITAGDRYDVTVVSSPKAFEVLSPYKKFRLMGFGFKLRSDLIRRWYQVGTDLSNNELQEKVFVAEQLINSILGKGLVPMTAFNVLVLLQTIEVNETGALANAGLAQYYEFLIRRSLLDAKVRNDELDEHISYLSYLAWEMHKRSRAGLSEGELAEFTLRFSKDVHPTGFRQRLDTLEAAKVLIQKDDEYIFRYSYLRYFFVARYIAEQLEEEPGLRDVVKQICRHLYLKDNANIAIFLAHHSHSAWIVQEIASVLNDLLSDIQPLNLDRDTELINSWVSEKARIAVDTSDVVQNQRSVREQDDSAPRFREVEHTTELSSIKELDQLSQLNLLFKTSEILGQVLKGRYGSIRHDRKVALIENLFDAPLRGVNFFLSLVNSAPDALLQEISERIRTKLPSISRERADNVAKRFLLTAIGAVADSFLARQGEIVGSPKLVEAITEVASKNGGHTYQLLSISSQLSYPNKVPLEGIRTLAKQLDRNFFGYKLLQGLVARHLYMFSLPSNESHSLAAAVGIDVHGQRSIELRSAMTKKLPATQAKVRHPVSLLARLQGSFLANNKTVKGMMERYARPEEKSPPDGTRKPSGQASEN